MNLRAHTDTFLEIGSTHRICQDYVMASTNSQFGLQGNEMVVVCDGCSSSRDVDVGARVLAHSAVLVTNLLGAGDGDVLGPAIIARAYRSIRDLGLPATALDATLLLACHVREINRVIIHAWGDGLIHYDLGGVRRTIHVHYPTGAPYYLSYRLDSRRDADYAATFAVPKEITSELTVDGETSAILLREPWGQPLTLDIPAAPGYVLLASDGVNSFQQGDAVPYAEIVQEMSAFKSTTGDFITRRMNFFKRRAQREGMTHYDDLGLAGFSLEEAPVTEIGSTGTIHNWPTQPWEM